MRKAVLYSLVFIAACAGLDASHHPCLAQDVSVADAVVLMAPGLTVDVLREGSTFANLSYCCCNPRQLECRAAFETPSYPPAGHQIGVDAAGNLYHLAFQSDQIDFPNGEGWVVQRTSPGGSTIDLFGLYRCIGIDPACNSVNRYFDYIFPFYLDVTNGRIQIIAGVRQMNAQQQAVDQVVGIIQVLGLPQMFDTLLTFTPGQQAMSILTPAHPDGFRAADSLQVWTGNVRSMLDWSQAESLTCEAAQNPTPGQVVSVPDTLSDPAVGEGRYYLVVSQSGPDRRLGRQYVTGAFSARQPAGLPICQ